MSKNDLNTSILEKVISISERCIKIEADLANMREDISEIKVQDTIQNKLLDEHIAGVNINRARLDVEVQNRKDALQSIEKRLTNVEFVPNLFKNLKKSITWIAGLVTSIGIVTKYFNLW